MSVHSRLAVLGAGTVLGGVLTLGAGAAPALACEAAPAPAAAADAPSPAAPSAPASDSPTASAPASASASASGGEPAATVALLPPADRTLVAGGAPAEFTAEIGNTGTAALTAAAPLPALRNDAAQEARQALRADDLLLQVATPAGWEPLPLSTGCDGVLRGDGDSLATDIAPGRAVRYTFRLSVTARDAAVQQVDVRLGLRSGAAGAAGSVPHARFLVTRPAPAAAESAPPASAAPAATAAGSVPRTGTLGLDSRPEPTRSGTATPTATGAPSAVAAAGVAEHLLAPTGGGRPPVSLLISGVALITLGAVGLALVLAHRPARHR
ncbi:hypothetical protein [Kitasatospora sp. NPDC090308]|uniref:hypothetical protein n=1 Tax=Kitasatospora sp. NPDC090308 TaxID=3364082 RepID=UPI003822CE99